ncbi:MAG TPA: hypothetical protein VFV09_14700 [Actinomycetota bacterium]|jgi:hypothetical protein|nr:hypothetical protein [Actinomycetota bacterium]
MTQQPFDPHDLGALTLAAEGQAGALETALKDHGWTVWRLEGDGAAGAAGVFDRASRDLPSPFPTRPVNDWTAFTDSLWEAVHVSGSDDCALIWTGVHHLLDGALGDLLDGSNALIGLSRGLNSPAKPATGPKRFRSLLLGRGPNFPELEGLTS